MKARRELLARFFRAVNVIPYTPKPSVITGRLRELESMGLQDLQEFPGISSPVRQYAITSLASAMAAAAGDDKHAAREFITQHSGLLERADALQARYGLRPISPEEAVGTIRGAYDA